MKDLQELRASGAIIFEAITGSRAYGLDTPESDTDIRGVFIAPPEQFFALECPMQINDEEHNVCFWELNKFVELLMKANPTALELLMTPDDCVVQRDPLMDHLDPALFFTVHCRDTFAGYAHAQIKKAHGLNKKILNPMPEERKKLLDFCYIAEGQGSVPVLDWLAKRALDPERCGLVNVPHMTSLQAIFYDETGDKHYKGLMHHEDSGDIALSSVVKGESPLAYMCCNRDGYAKHCRQFADYWKWVKARNEARYEQTLEHGKRYDAKNMMHTFRLLRMAEEIALEGRPLVRRPDREELLRIKRGEADYDELLALADAKLASVHAAYDACDLPESCNLAAAQQALVSMRLARYGLID